MGWGNKGADIVGTFVTAIDYPLPTINFLSLNLSLVDTPALSPSLLE